jgi:hypothetical protein
MLKREGKPMYPPLTEEESVREGQCVKEDHDGASFMEFVTEDDRAHGFPYSQLMGYTLERAPESEHESNAPEDRLHVKCRSAVVKSAVFWPDCHHKFG